MTMNRRSLLSTAAATPLALLLAACPGAMPSIILADAKLLLGGLTAMAPSLLTLMRASPADTATVSAIMADMQAAVAALTAQGAAVDKTTARQIIADVQAVVPIALRYLPAGSPYVMIANAALSLLPAIASVVGLVSATSSSSRMSPALARLVLAAAK